MIYAFPSQHFFNLVYLKNIVIKYNIATKALLSLINLLAHLTHI